jgi:hypothetical protein
MSSWIHKITSIGVTVRLGYALLASMDPAASLPVFERVEFERGPAKQAQSPNDKASIRLLAPANADADPKMEAVSGDSKLSLGSLRRSAFVFWRPDSGAAVLWNLAYSNRYLVRLIRTTPALSEVKSFDDMIRQRALREFHPGKLIHYWPYIEGWTRQNELAVVVCTDGAPPKSPANTHLVGFQRGYLIDTEKIEIRSEFPAAEFTERIGVNPCL